MSLGKEAFQRLVVFFLIVLFLGLAAFLWKRASPRRGELETSPFSRIAEKLNAVRPQEFCDEQNAERRLKISQIVDRFQGEIKDLWARRRATEEPAFAVLNVGAIQLKVSPKLPKSVRNFDSSAWSWEDARAIILRIQAEKGGKENEERWRDLDSATRYLLEKDYLRLIRHVDFLNPDISKHSFRVNPRVQRTGSREFTIPLNIGDFRGYEKVFQHMLESEWQGAGYRVRVRWEEPGDGIYSLKLLSSGNRCFVNHKKQVLLISNLAWTKTVAHELGHILGFDDHYYNVWHAQNCYYTQESRLNDIMSNSERGGVTARHWQLLDKAYPRNGKRPAGLFEYSYGKD